MRKVLFAILLFLLASPIIWATPGAIRCGKLLEVASGQLLVDQVVVFDDSGTITAVGSAASTPLPSGVRALDLSAATCLPGLIDVHTHLTDDPGDTGYGGLGISVPRAAVMGVKNARLTLRAGFTTVRNLDARGYSDVALRDGINAGEVEGPRMLVSGPALGITGGHADNNLLPFEYHQSLEGIADGPWAARAKVREVIKYGADVIKVMASGGVFSKGDQPGTPQYTLEELRAITEEAHKLGRRVAAHAHGTQSIKDAIRAGVDSVEHASLIDDDGIALAKQHGTYLVPTQYLVDWLREYATRIGLPAMYTGKMQEVTSVSRQNVKKAFDAGAKIAFGTDAGVYPHGLNAHEFAVYVQMGMTPLQAIQAATISAADLIGWASKVGALKPGYYADVIAVEGDPTLNIRILESVKFVMKGGLVVRNDFGPR